MPSALGVGFADGLEAGGLSNGCAAQGCLDQLDPAIHLRRLIDVDVIEIETSERARLPSERAI